MIKKVVPRKKIDISYSKLCKLLWWNWRNQGVTTKQMAKFNAHYPNSLIFYTVRTGFDALLSILNFPKGSEILMSPITIPDMVKIVKYHELKPVMIDIDLHTLKPDLEEIKRKTNKNTKAIVIAHLFGTNFDVEYITKNTNLFTIEDCAQSFNYRGNTAVSDVTMSSFGTIKTATRVGGALFFIKDKHLYHSMNKMNNSYPIQSTKALATKILKTTALRVITEPYLYGTVFINLASILGYSHNELSISFVRGFKYKHISEFIKKLRQRPCNTLKRHMIELMNEEKQIGARLIKRKINGELGIKIFNAAKQDIIVIGDLAREHFFWLFPVIAKRRQQLADHMLKFGFDLTPGSSQLDVIDDTVESEAKRLMDNIVYLPLDMELAEFQRMCFQILSFYYHEVTVNSIDSGLHSVFTALDLPFGSQVLVCDRNIKRNDSVSRIIELHGLVAKCVVFTSEIEMERAITDKTKIVITSECLSPSNLAMNHGILIIQDCSNSLSLYLYHENGNFDVKMCGNDHGAIFRFKDSNLMRKTEGITPNHVFDHNKIPNINELELRPSVFVAERIRKNIYAWHHHKTRNIISITKLSSLLLAAILGISCIYMYFLFI